MGREAKSRAQHLLEGTVPQAKPEKPSYVQGSRPRFPKHLSQVGRQEFKRCVEILEERGTSSAGDYATLGVYAEIFARWVRAKQMIGEELMIQTTITDNNGSARTVSRLNPLLKVVEACESRMLPLIKEIGLGPASRDKVKQTLMNRELEVVPGSVADLYPALVETKGGK
jgi:P27 family predicted phage terminase small subunit